MLIYMEANTALNNWVLETRPIFTTFILIVFVKQTAFWISLKSLTTVTQFNYIYIVIIKYQSLQYVAVIVNPLPSSF